MHQRSHVWIRRVISANICISSAHWQEIHAAFTARLTLVHGSISVFHWAGNLGGRQRGGRIPGTLQRGQTNEKARCSPQIFSKAQKTESSAKSQAKQMSTNRHNDMVELRKTFICLCVCRTDLCGVGLLKLPSWIYWLQTHKVTDDYTSLNTEH